MAIAKSMVDGMSYARQPKRRIEKLTEYAEKRYYDKVGIQLSDNLKIRSQRGLQEIYELLGRNLSGAYLHMVYRVLPDRRLRVFHMNGMTEAQRRRYRRYRT